MTIKILQQNTDYRNNNDDISGFIDILLEKNPHILLLSEIGSKPRRDIILNHLKDAGYSIIMPKEYNESTDGKSYCICMLAIRQNEFKFEEREWERGRHEPIPGKEILTLRYIAGTLIHSESGKEIKIYFTHIPSKPLEYKAHMLFNAYCFWNKNKNKYAFIGGDFNTETETGRTTMEGIFRPLYKESRDTTNHEPTWRNKEGKWDKCLDYALVSESLWACGCSTTIIETSSDHKALLTEINL